MDIWFIFNFFDYEHFCTCLLLNICTFFAQIRKDGIAGSQEVCMCLFSSFPKWLYQIASFSPPLPHPSLPEHACSPMQAVFIFFPSIFTSLFL